MDEPRGWVKIHRKILLNPIVCKDSDHFAVWMYLILEATHIDVAKVFNGEKITLHPGQLIRCAETIASKLRISKSKTYRILKLLESEKQIETLSKRHGTLITLLNWAEYQTVETLNEIPMENQWKTDEKPVERNKNIKNTKKGEKKEFVPPTIEEIKKYIIEKELTVDGDYFLDYFTKRDWVDSNGNKVKSWRSKILTWDEFEKKKNNNKQEVLLPERRLTPEEQIAAAKAKYFIK